MRITWHSGAFVQQSLEWKSNYYYYYYYIFWMRVWGLRYTACNAHASYCHLWLAPLHNIFPLSLISGTIFERKKEIYWTQNGCFDFLYKFCLKFCLKIDDIWSKMYIGFRVKYPLFLSDFNETWIFLTNFRKIINIKFHENENENGSRAVTCGQTDGQTRRI